MVVLGYEDTMQVTIEDMVHHTAAVARAEPDAFIVADLPWMSYHVSKEETVINAAKLIRAGADAVKLEGGAEIVESIQRILTAGIPVMGHLGLTPQSIYKFGTYTVRAKEDEEAAKLIADAKLLEESGCFAIVFEKIPAHLAKQVSEAISIPTIGIGAGQDCDGQVLVLHDMLGITTDFSPRFLRRYLDLENQITGAVQQYCDDVRSGDFPNQEESY